MSIENEGAKPEEEDLIPVEAPLEDEAPKADADEDEDDDEGDEDSRLATSDDDHEDDITSSSNSSRRKKRREQQKKARERAEAEIAMLRQRNAEMERRMAALEGRAVRTEAQTIDQTLAQKLHEVQQAELIFAKATEAGNGEDAMAALRIRDEARAEAARLHAQREQYARAASQPQVDPNAARYAQAWMAANPWYDPQARDRDSLTAKTIDAQLVRDGYNPATREYWEELTARVADALDAGDDSGHTNAKADPKPRRKAPPTGNTREHVPPSTRKEIYVTPERKQAMIEAGVWDDPQLRQKYLRAYRDYDQNSAR